MFALIPLILSGIAGATGLIANWWFQITDFKSALIFVGALVAIALLSLGNSPWARVGIMAVLAVGLYAKGHVDGGHRVETRYETARNSETERQQRANEDAQKEAARRANETEAYLAGIRDQAEKNRRESELSPNADRESLDSDAVRRLNRLRPGPERKRLEEAPRPPALDRPAS